MRRTDAQQDRAFGAESRQRAQIAKSVFGRTFVRCRTTVLRCPTDPIPAVLRRGGNGDAHFAGIKNSNTLHRRISFLEHSFVNYNGIFLSLSATSLSSSSSPFASFRDAGVISPACLTESADFGVSFSGNGTLSSVN